jgi:hypothetical protein
VKLLNIFLILGLVLGIQKYPLASSAQGDREHHDHNGFLSSTLEMLEFVLTGNLTHTHEHESNEDSHSHSHQHQINYQFPIADFRSTQMNFLIPSLKVSWIGRYLEPVTNAFYFEILRPPIVYS